MVYLLSRCIKFVLLGVMLAAALAVVAGAAAFVITAVALLIIFMFADALVESVFVGCKSLLTYGSLDSAEIAFYGRFSLVAKRYSNLRR
jgi:hypothetical protein